MKLKNFNPPHRARQTPNHGFCRRSRCARPVHSHLSRIILVLACGLNLAVAMCVSLTAEETQHASADQPSDTKHGADLAPDKSPDSDETAVRVGRDVLSAPPDRFPWYDAQNDSLRRIDLGPSDKGDRDSDQNSSSSRGQRGSRYGNYHGKGGSGRSSNHRNGGAGDDDSSGGSSGAGSGDEGSDHSSDDSSSQSNPSLDPAAASATWLIWVAWFAIGAALGVLAFYLIRAYLNREARAAKDSQTSALSDEPIGVEALPANLPLPKGDLWSEIGRLYEAGDYNRAIVYLYAYQLIQLDRHQWIRLARGKTNREYVHELSSRPELQGLLARTMVPFESVFFGGHSLDRASFEGCWGEAEAFRRLVEQAPA